MKRYGYSIGLAALSALVLIGYAAAVAADRKPPYRLATESGDAAVMDGFVLEGLGARLTADGGRERTGSRFLSMPFHDLMDPDHYFSERNELIVAHRSFMKGHQNDDSYYRDDETVIGADVDENRSMIDVRLLDRASGGVRTFELPLQLPAGTQRSFISSYDRSIVDVQLENGRIHLLVRGNYPPASAGQTLRIYEDHIVDSASGERVDTVEVFRSVPETELSLETTVGLIDEVRPMDGSGIVMLNVKRLKHDDGAETERAQQPILKEWRLIGYDYASGETWDLPKAGLDVIKRGLEPRLHEGKLYAFNEHVEKTVIHFLDSRTGAAAAEPLALEQSATKQRSVRLQGGLIYDSFHSEIRPTVAVYDEASRRVVYRGGVEQTDPRFEKVRFQYFTFNYYGK
ncbi:hypothetical protein HGI30_13570 [Paenibacillus albicereus]|uniref:Uncharacterized protein n=1 Tax=Paenibacillus albicereus TaxID=2726185 RepID=A0A6H2GZE5_9BACL|nr:hypothetical protein [Paenibacillus albicereus]QJC52488.1 hypothetical protein HGI30_13570 [Paenibacillus albicereus]